MNRWWAGLFTVALCHGVFGSVRGKSLLTEIEWQRVSCRYSLVTGRLNLAWGPQSAIEVTLPHFKSFIENERLVLDVTNAAIGNVSFIDHKFWVVDSHRHENSRCRLIFADMKKNELEFRVGIVCQNLVPLETSDGGLTDVGAEMTDEPVVCEKL